MNAQITLTIEQEIIKRAKAYAKQRNSSLSEIVGSYLELLTNARQADAGELSPITKSLKGAFKNTDPLDYQSELQARREDKYLS